jgi:hypothetical protein
MILAHANINVLKNVTIAIAIEHVSKHRHMAWFLSEAKETI